MQKLALLILTALMAVGLARAQETLTGEWDCLAFNPGPHDGLTSLTCRSYCVSDTPDETGSLGGQTPSARLRPMFAIVNRRFLRGRSALTFAKISSYLYL